MSDKILPVQYYLEVFEDTPSLGAAAYSVQTSSPLSSMNIGDTYSHSGSGDWIDPPTLGEEFYISDIKHFIWEIEGSHVGHKTIVRVKKR
ncbi:hypothetical protein [Serratia fonticola]|uniref:hypothetical protein n=1 Tax=Serratia fonticola TaxID=47917 RepID=UPI0034C60422